MAISSQIKTLVASGKFGNAQKNAKDAAEDIEPADARATIIITNHLIDAPGTVSPPVGVVLLPRSQTYTSRLLKGFIIVSINSQYSSHKHLDQINRVLKQLLAKEERNTKRKKRTNKKRKNSLRFWVWSRSWHAPRRICSKVVIMGCRHTGDVWYRAICKWWFITTGSLLMRRRGLQRAKDCWELGRSCGSKLGERLGEES